MKEHIIFKCPFCSRMRDIGVIERYNNENTETKRELLDRAEAERWTMVFEHDPRVVRASIERDSKSFCYKELDTLDAAT